MVIHVVGWGNTMSTQTTLTVCTDGGDGDTPDDQQPEADSVVCNESVIRALAAAMSDEITHKKDGFTDRVVRRLLDSAVIPDTTTDSDEEDTTGQYRVAGVDDLGDEYATYSVDWTAPHLKMCSCYQHSFGMSRARRICTHVGAAIIHHAATLSETEDADAALDYATEMGERLNESATEYISQREYAETKVEELDIESEYSKTKAERLPAQAAQLVENDDGTWTAIGGECEGCTIRLTETGYRCDHSDPDKRSKEDCYGKLAAYVLSDGREARPPAYNAGDAFTVDPAELFDDDSAPSLVVVTSRNDRENESVVTFAAVESHSETIDTEYTVPLSDANTAFAEGALTRTELDDEIIVFDSLVQTQYGEKVLIESPKDAKADIKALDWDDTKRSWDDRREGWTIEPSATQDAIDHLEDSGWTVVVEGAVAENVSLQPTELDLSIGSVYIITADGLIEDVEAPKNAVQLVTHHEDSGMYALAPVFGRTEDSSVAWVTPDELRAAFNGGELSVTTKAGAADAAFTGIVDTQYGEKVLIKSPKKLKDDIKALDWDTTKRSWESSHGGWAIEPDSLEYAIEELSEGWTVHVADAVLDAKETPDIS